ncbi:4-(cytidine 5'-diphospho)-2-C-methyl-D-erythritol kinase [Ancylomarina euxinus]|uniref:4-diphosphocytidyl-2-C-methyl-D-erythritol kinase n=1 Tax=Ancylomarina euxinus TaxID=2283627 RepID=A0A425Y527_9BACT|nr:4-(cytidine 5'-diphospho)-2-C-methyl-D-erythritol kinase [Ancylomarina euxinus]MCZ4694447.1 4-(cytidine 5'-diphospho)-2-C-methyl-D-erythritol kinase [Ancylomarina euxinus]MUP16654.1 4-(cytidine 5'-diphospho)-2-C-methyl-D-erythritol kinase [Ancylomarina euxinus]RRG23545.1 4-(cytidine 5'-diphospho)-2-C-methyl-D-erythritol kinase [Ancylomarina euxinus]
MLTYSNAKINIGLNIVEKRRDGFHNIETIFFPISMQDAIEIVDSKDDSPYTLSTSGIPINIEAKDNIVVKAYELIKAKYNFPAQNIHLHKNIPFGAGLGGGSANAAYMIKLLNQKFKLEMSDEEMEDEVRILGSDCAFFIKNKPAFANEKGDRLNPIDLDLCDYHILLIKPDIHISTPEAYANIKPNKPKTSLKELIKQPIETWKSTIINDFENSIFPKHPLLAKIKDELYEQGAVYASMSGSGSTMFGIFKNEPSILPEWEKHFCWKNRL